MSLELGIFWKPKLIDILLKCPFQLLRTVMKFLGYQNESFQAVMCLTKRCWCCPWTEKNKWKNHKHAWLDNMAQSLALRQNMHRNQQAKILINIYRNVTDKRILRPWLLLAVKHSKQWSTPSFSFFESKKQDLKWNYTNTCSRKGHEMLLQTSTWKLNSVNLYAVPTFDQNQLIHHIYH